VNDSANSPSPLMMFVRLRKLVRLVWGRLQVAIALTPLMGFSLGCYFAYEEPGTPAAAATAGDVQRGRLLYETHCIASAELKQTLVHTGELAVDRRRSTRRAICSSIGIECSLTKPCVSSA
jgi:hypothetical protein